MRGRKMRCIRDNKGRFAKHDFNDKHTTGTVCVRCGLIDRLRGLLKDIYLPTLINFQMTEATSFEELIQTREIGEKVEFVNHFTEI